MKLTSVFAALAVAAGCATHAFAQDYPSHPITIIVPFPAGGPTDTLASGAKRFKLTIAAQCMGAS